MRPTFLADGGTTVNASASRNRTVRIGAAAAVVLAAAGAAGCTLTDFNPPPPQTASDAAASMERTRCGPDVDESRLLPVVTGSAVDSVEPLYTALPGGKSGSETRLYGAVIRIRATQGVTAEWLDCALECHGARQVLRHPPEDTLASDPFWLPGRMVDIDTESARDSFKVAVRGDTTDDAQEIFIRATAYLATNQHEARTH